MEECCRIFGYSKTELLEDWLDEDVKAFVLENCVDFADVLLLHYYH